MPLPIIQFKKTNSPEERKVTFNEMTTWAASSQASYCKKQILKLMSQQAFYIINGVGDPKIFTVVSNIFQGAIQLPDLLFIQCVLNNSRQIPFDELKHSITHAASHYKSQLIKAHVKQLQIIILLSAALIMFSSRRWELSISVFILGLASAKFLAEPLTSVRVQQELKARFARPLATDIEQLREDDGLGIFTQVIGLFSPPKPKDGVFTSSTSIEKNSATPRTFSSTH